MHQCVAPQADSTLHNKTSHWTMHQCVSRRELIMALFETFVPVQTGAKPLTSVLEAWDEHFLVFNVMRLIHLNLEPSSQRSSPESSAKINKCSWVLMESRGFKPTTGSNWASSPFPAAASSVCPGSLQAMVGSVLSFVDVLG